MDFLLPSSKLGTGLAAHHLLEALQRALHVLITPEDIGEGALHRVQVGQSSLLLRCHRLQSLLGTQLVALLILCQGGEGEGDVA